MKLLIMYSSRTGNTRRLAEGIATYLPEFEVSLLPVEEADALPEADAYLVGYWADRGHADEKSQALIGRLAGKKVGLFGTLGGLPRRKACPPYSGGGGGAFAGGLYPAGQLFVPGASGPGAAGAVQAAARR